MAVNLDKEAYYRRIKRFYGNWKVRNGPVEARHAAIRPLRLTVTRGKWSGGRQRYRRLS